MNKTSSAQQVLVAISDALHLVDAYSTATEKVEVERLYSIGTDFSSLIQALRTSEAFEMAPEIEQRDKFFDIQRGGRWLFASTGHYVRLREERTDANSFLSAEIKKAYPGPDWNPNARPAKDMILTEEELHTWHDMLRALGLEPEREYLKHRVSCTSIEEFDGMVIELEVDRFSDDHCNGVLMDHAFVSASIEVPGTEQQKAELALASILRVLKSLGVPFVACEGCYEDYFYGLMPLPAVDSIPKG